MPLTDVPEALREYLWRLETSPLGHVVAACISEPLRENFHEIFVKLDPLSHAQNDTPPKILITLIHHSSSADMLRMDDRQSGHGAEEHASGLGLWQWNRNGAYARC